MGSDDKQNVSEVVAFADAAGTEALEQANFSDFTAPDRVSVVLGSAGGAVNFMESRFRWFFSGDGDPSVYNVPGSTRGNLASELSIRKNFTKLSTGRNSSSDVFSHALIMLRADRVGAIQKQSLPPTINQEEPDPAHDLFYVPNETITHEVATTLIHTLKFGRRNSCLVVEKP